MDEYGCYLERVEDTTRTWNLMRDGVWQARITFDPLLGIVVNAGKVAAPERLALRKIPDYPFCVTRIGHHRIPFAVEAAG